MPDFLQRLFSSEGFMPHGMCYLWRPGIMGFHVVADALIGLAYVSISGSLAYLVYRSRREIPFRAMLLAFGLFIVACGATHFMEIWTLWQPVYWTAGGVKAVTAVASVATAIALPPLIPVVLRTLQDAKLSITRAAEVERAHAALEAAHAQLRRREQQLAEAQHLAKLGSWEWDIAADSVWWSDELYRIYGLERASPITLASYLELVHPRDRERVASVINGALERRKPFAFDHEIMRPDGTVCTLHARGEVSVDDHGDAVRMFGTGQDITERRAEEDRARRLAAERAARSQAESSVKRMAYLAEASTLLASSLDYQETLMRTAQIMVPVLGDYCQVDVLQEDGSFRRVATAYAHGFPKKLMAATTPLTPTSAAPMHPLAHAVRVGDAALFEIDGSALEAMNASRGASALEGVRCLVMPFDAWGRVLGGITTLSVDTKRKLGGEELLLASELGRRAGLAVDNATLYRNAQEANRTKANFLAAMSHELRTPLNAIVGYADLMDAGIGGALNERQLAHVQRIRASAWHLLALIEEILTFARIEAGREEPRLETVDVADVAREALALIEPEARRKGLPIRLSLPDKTPVLKSDRIKLRQVLTNLLSNAVKFTTTGTIELSVEQNDGHVVFGVKDTGVGIAREHLHLIFEPFRQIGDTHAGRAGGTGLGLTVSQRLIRLLGGELEVESWPGVGSIFRARLPILPPQLGRAT